MNGKTRYVENKGSGYTIMVVSHADKDLVKAGFKGGMVLYCAFTAGMTHAHHDQYELIRQLPGNDRWLIEEFADLREEVFEEQANEET